MINVYLSILDSFDDLGCIVSSALVYQLKRMKKAFSRISDDENDSSNPSPIRGTRWWHRFLFGENDHRNEYSTVRY
jgi:hypothetical protein